MPGSKCVSGSRGFAMLAIRVAPLVDFEGCNPSSRGASLPSLFRVRIGMRVL